MKRMQIEEYNATLESMTNRINELREFWFSNTDAPRFYFMKRRWTSPMKKIEFELAFISFCEGVLSIGTENVELQILILRNAICTAKLADAVEINKLPVWQRLITELSPFLVG